MQIDFDRNKLSKIIEDANKKIPKPCVGVVVLGSTGAGKSTIVNAFFPDANAETGIGAPITQEAKWFPERRQSNEKLRILDTKGLEEKEYQITIDAAISAVREANSSSDENDHAHVAWLLIKEASARVQDSHQEIARRFTEEGIPVVAVITQAIQKDEEFKAKVREMLPEVKDVVQVNSEPFKIADHTVKAFGLDHLYFVTSRAMPEGKSRDAFQMSSDQTLVPLDDKRKLARKYVKAASAAATVIGATPIPIADAALLMPTQATMILSVSSAYGMKVDKESSMALLSAVAAPIGGTAIGLAIVGSIFKVFPGLGTLAGAAITATTAGSITLAIGNAYSEFLYYLSEKNGNRPPQTSQIIEGFSDFYKENGNAIKESLKMLKK